MCTLYPSMGPEFFLIFLEKKKRDGCSPQEKNGTIVQKKRLESAADWKGGAWMVADMAGRDFLIIDFEFTTHKKLVGKPRAFFPEIIEVGAVRMGTPELALGEEYQSFVKPRFFPRLTKECMEIAIINQEDVDGGVDLGEMLGGLNSLYQEGRTYFVAWGDSDREVLATDCKRYGLDYPFIYEDYIDLAAAYKQHYGKDRTPSLKHAVEESGIERLGWCHMALDDAKNTGLLLAHLLRDGWRPGMGV